MENEQKVHLQAIRNILSVFLAILILYLLKVLSNLLVPLAFALFLAVLFQPIVSLLRKKLSLNMSVIVTTLLFISVFFGLGALFFGAIKSLVENSDQISAQVSQTIAPWINTLSGYLGQEVEVADLQEMLSSFIPMEDLVSASGSFLGSISGMAAELLMVILYFAGLLGAISQLDSMIEYLLRGRNQASTSQAAETFSRIIDSVSIYIKVKTIVSMLTGIGIGLVCWIFGIRYALAWGFLAFALNYIPYIGSLIAIVPPLLISAMNADSVSQVLILFVALESIQLIMGNAVEPKLMGSSLSINTVTVLFGFVFWAYMWGTAGMLLAVPLTFLIKVTMENISGAEILVRLMDNKKAT